MCLLLCLLLQSPAQDSTAAPKGPVRVYILAGQSNMQGTGFVLADPKRNDGKGSLEYLAKNPATAQRFAPLLAKADGPEPTWKVRDDVWIHYLDRKGRLTAGFGAGPDRIGPELGFGQIIGNQSIDLKAVIPSTTSVPSNPIASCAAHPATSRGMSGSMAPGVRRPSSRVRGSSPLRCPLPPEMAQTTQAASASTPSGPTTPSLSPTR